jgi:hypothetical protein
MTISPPLGQSWKAYLQRLPRRIAKTLLIAGIVTGTMLGAAYGNIWLQIWQSEQPVKPDMAAAAPSEWPMLNLKGLSLRYPAESQSFVVTPQYAPNTTYVRLLGEGGSYRLGIARYDSSPPQQATQEDIDEQRGFRASGQFWTTTAFGINPTWIPKLHDSRQDVQLWGGRAELVSGMYGLPQRSEVTNCYANSYLTSKVAEATWIISYSSEKIDGTCPGGTPTEIVTKMQQTLIQIANSAIFTPLPTEPLR